MRDPITAAAICIAITCACAGCIERLMRVESDPPGATLYVDGEQCGTTPVDLPFTAYGKREVFLQMDKRFSRREVVALEPPLYALFPIDFVTDVLWPFTIRDVQTFRFAMPAADRPDVKELQARAEKFAGQARKLLREENAKRSPAPEPKPLAGKEAQPEPPSAKPAQ